MHTPLYKKVEQQVNSITEGAHITLHIDMYKSAAIET